MSTLPFLVSLRALSARLAVDERTIRRWIAAEVRQRDVNAAGLGGESLDVPLAELADAYVSALGRSAGWSHVAKAKRALARFVEAFPLSDGALRHSHVDARMTANIYTKLVGEDVREAIAKLPTL